MKNWEERFNNRLTKKDARGRLAWRKTFSPDDIKRFIRDELRRESKRDKLRELIDYVKDSKSKTQVLIDYVMHTGSCYESKIPSDILLDQLGMTPMDPETRILYYLEKYFEGISD